MSRSRAVRDRADGLRAGRATGELASASVATAVGAAVGAAVGGVVGGRAAKAPVEWYDTDLENAYWRETYESCSYFDPKTSYDEIQPAYRYGWEARIRFVEKSFDEVEAELVAGWGMARAHSRLSWPQARSACRDAWRRIDHAMRENGQPAGNGRG